MRLAAILSKSKEQRCRVQMGLRLSSLGRFSSAPGPDACSRAALSALFCSSLRSVDHQVWYFTPVILGLERLRQEDGKFVTHRVRAQITKRDMMDITSSSVCAVHCVYMSMFICGWVETRGRDQVSPSSAPCLLTCAHTMAHL